MVVVDCGMIYISFVQTQVYSVLEIKTQKDTEAGKETETSKYTVRGPAEQVKHDVTIALQRYGCCILDGAVPEEPLTQARNIIKNFVKRLLSYYDSASDDFDDFNKEDHDVVRMPRIGRGKHNIHFDPEFSKEHAALEKLAKESSFTEILSAYMNKTCVLRECGISVTRPAQRDFHRSKEEGDESEDNEKFGEGMEWHSDGGKGEATVLMSLEDLKVEMGQLRVVPTSHQKYVDGVGHTEEVLKGADNLKRLAPLTLLLYSSLQLHTPLYSSLLLPTPTNSYQLLPIPTNSSLTLYSSLLLSTPLSSSLLLSTG